MLSEKQLTRYAEVLWWGLRTSRPTGYKKGDIILLQFDREAIPLAEALYAKLLSEGVNAVPRMGLTSRMEFDFYQHTDDKQLTFQPPGQAKLFERLSGAAYLLAPESLTHLAQVDPKRIASAALARKPLRDILVSREEKGLFGWTLCMYPTEALAKAAGLTKREYAGQILSGCQLRAANPVAAWERIWRDAGEIKEWLNRLGIVSVRVESANCDLTVTMGEKRRFIGISGHNIPSFELFVSPDWRGTSGHFFADQASYRSGNLVRGIRLEFEQGRVVKCTAKEGEDFVNKQIRMDAGAAQVGEFSLTDKRFSRIDRFMANTLYDENFGGEYGNCHIAVGSSYSDTYAGNPAELTPQSKSELGFNDSALHWDMVNTENKRVTATLADGSRKLIYDAGQFAL